MQGNRDDRNCYPEKEEGRREGDTKAAREGPEVTVFLGSRKHAAHFCFNVTLPS